MAEQRHVDDGIRTQANCGTGLKRRGILAAAGAVVAGIVAKQAAQPVAAAGLTLETTNTVTGGTTTINVAAGFVNTVFEVDATASTANVLYIDAIRGRGQFTGAGVHGYGGDAKPNTNAGLGLQGTGGNGGVQPGGAVRDGGQGVYAYGGSGGIGGDGVYAHGGGAGAAGVRGGYGVYAEAGSGAATSAVYAINRFQSSTGHVGVTGVCTSAGGMGVVGQIASGSAVNTIGVYGVNNSTGDNSHGVYGATFAGNGVVGVTYGAGVLAGVYGYSNTAYGVIGSTTAAGYSGLTAITGTAGVAALAATSTNPNAYAAYFQGSTVVQGDFAVVGGNKSAAVKDASGQHRLVYCLESPESWFEDFGKAKLVNGRADIVLDKTFAEIAHMDDYMVFLTERGESNGLYVSTQGATGFTVQERGKGTSGVAFAYRVVAKRADSKGERLAKFDLPKIKVPDESKLRKPAPPRTAPPQP